MKKYMGLVFVGLLLSACSTPSPYEAGKSSADVPAHVDVIHLGKIFLYGGEADDPLKGSERHQKPDPLEEQDPSTNDQEVLAVAKSNIVSQLTNFGYGIVDGDSASADIKINFAVSYIPERVFFVHRQVGVLGYVYDANGNLLFRMGLGKASAAGVFGSIAQSRDELVSECARGAVVKVVTEMRKGTLENAPVAKTQKQSMLQTISSQH